MFSFIDIIMEFVISKSSRDITLNNVRPLQVYQTIYTYFQNIRIVQDWQIMNTFNIMLVSGIPPQPYISFIICFQTAEKVLSEIQRIPTQKSSHMCSYSYIYIRYTYTSSMVSVDSMFTLPHTYNLLCLRTHTKQY